MARCLAVPNLCCWLPSCGLVETCPTCWLRSAATEQSFEFGLVDGLVWAWCTVEWGIQGRAYFKLSAKHRDARKLPVYPSWLPMWTYRTCWQRKRQVVRGNHASLEAMSWDQCQDYFLLDETRRGALREGPVCLKDYWSDSRSICWFY